MLVEFQALVAPTSLGTPRRAVVGWDQNRLSMLIAVLETHAGLKLGAYDVFLNVAGGLRIVEPSADAAAAAALISSLTGAALPADRVYIGEVALTGALRPVSQTSARLKEAAKLGFHSAFLPKAGLDGQGRHDITLEAGGDVTDLVAGIAVNTPQKRKPQSTDQG